MNIIFASNNHNKIREINHLLGEGIRLTGLEEWGISEEIPEEEPTLEGNALAKARYVYSRTRTTVFADDTGLETEALEGMPGVKSARFAGENKDPEANIDKLLKMLEGKTSRKARFRTVIALIYDGNEFLFEGVADGVILKERQGKGGFGYDPVFLPEGYSQSFAEMTLEQKNLISHRAIAFIKLKEFLKTITAQNNI